VAATDVAPRDPGGIGRTSWRLSPRVAGCRHLSMSPSMSGYGIRRKSVGPPLPTDTSFGAPT